MVDFWRKNITREVKNMAAIMDAQIRKKCNFKWCDQRGFYNDDNKKKEKLLQSTIWFVTDLQNFMVLPIAVMG